MIKRTFLTLTAGAVCAGLLAPQISQAAAPDPANEIVLKRRPGVTTSQVQDTRDDADVQLARTLPLPGVEVVRAGRGQRETALRALRRSNRVQWAEPNMPRYAAASDRLFSLQWGLENTGQSVWGTRGTVDSDIDAEEAQQASTGTGQTVAVVDSGIDLNHPDFAGRLVAGYDFVSKDDTPQDGNGHGTHVAGAIAADADSTGVRGVAPDAKIMPLRVLDDTGRGYTADVAAAIDYAADRGVKIINLSLGSDTPSAVEQQAIHDHPGVLFVIAAGNGGADNIGDDSDTTPSYPASYNEPNIVSVGASDQKDKIAGFSNYGASSVDLFAPGVNSVSTYPQGKASNLDKYFKTGDGYELLQGTSMATPYATGTAALMYAKRPGLTPVQARQALITSVDPVPAMAGKSVAGGRLNAAQALGVEPPPPADTTPPAAPTDLTATAGNERAELDWADSSDADLDMYRVYRYTSGEWQQIAAPAVSELHVDGLVNDTEYRFRVAAVDKAGNLSGMSAAVYVTPEAPDFESEPADPTPTPQPPQQTPTPQAPQPPHAPQPPETPQPPAQAPQAPPSAPAPPTRPQPGPVAAPALAALKVSGSASKRTVSFRVAASAPVSVRVYQRVHGHWRSRGVKTVSVRSGMVRWTVKRTLAGIRLGHGQFKVTLVTSANSKTAAFTLR